MMGNMYINLSEDIKTHVFIPQNLKIFKSKQISLKRLHDHKDNIN